MRNNMPFKMKTPGPSHQIDELKAPGSLWSKDSKQVNTVLIQAVWPQVRLFFRLLEAWRKGRQLYP